MAACTVSKHLKMLGTVVGPIWWFTALAARPASTKPIQKPVGRALGISSRWMCPDAWTAAN